MIKMPINLQDLRRKIYTKAKASPSMHGHRLSATAPRSGMK
jgi:hypothetical protein